MKAVLFSAVGILLASVAACSGGLNAGSCAMDGEIATQDRADIDDLAMKYVSEAISQRPEDAYGLMTKETQQSTPLDHFVAGMKQYVQATGPYQNIHVSHTFLIRNSGGGPNARAICGTLANDQWVSVEIKPGRSQAYVEIVAQTRNNDWAFTLWLLPENKTWAVQYFHLGAKAIVGQTPEMLLESARSERDAGHPFNAAMLYAGVQGTIDRGPAFQLGIAQELQEDLSKFAVPAELEGRPPFLWKMNGESYSVAQTSIIGVAKQLGLLFILPQKTWTGDEGADKQNRAFISAFIATHPDYLRVFKFLVARALKPDKSGGFGTVYESGKGFD